MAPDAPSAGSVELGVDDGVGHRGKEPAGKIEDEIAGGAHAILDRSAEQPKRPHVEDQMQPSAVQEHVREERLPVGERVAEVEIRREIERGDERKAPEKGLELIRTRTPLVKENQAVRRDQRPRDERRTAVRRGIQDRKHGGRCRCGRRSIHRRRLAQEAGSCCASSPRRH